MEKRIEIRKKICMLGAFGVGKTSLVRQFVFNKYEDKYLSTIGVLISQKQLPPFRKSDSGRIEQLEFIIWDLANIEKYNKMTKNYFRGAAGAIAVCDLTRAHTFEEIDQLLNKFLEINPKSRIVLAGNKIDLVDQQLIEMERFLHLSDSYQTTYTLTSAKTGENVEQLFVCLGNELLKSE